MSSTGPQHSQQNSVGQGNLYATQRGNINFNTQLASKRGLRTDSKVLLVLFVVDVAAFFYGMLAYTNGKDTTGDGWRAFSFLFLMAVTISLIGRWVRRRV